MYSHCNGRSSGEQATSYCIETRFRRGFQCNWADRFLLLSVSEDHDKHCSCSFLTRYGSRELSGSLIIGIVDDVTRRGGKVSWVSDNLNKGHYDYYYWLLFLLSLVNFFYYLLCCWAFGSEDKEEYDDGEAMEEVEMHPYAGSPIRHIGV
ncbi:hypothetical protein POTOM_043180 [Populus tomentosa]|uniref:Proton-dependent oligopeptide transport family protein n=1 Tax=Populus tomentosa TaxID=118781 RepID=A0A8X7YLY3_POPTO|nr:hypothetical protein POTOM_043180 [Populus tomentosa]